MAQLELRNVQKNFGSTTVIHGVDLIVKEGEFCVFVGPSGCGKSTLLRMIAGLEECSGGQVWMDNADVTHEQPARRGIAMVFQSYALYPHMTVAENMGFGLKIAKEPKAEISTKVAVAARTLQIEHLLERRPRDLSGGQRQRVAIGRAIVRAPKMFLFDEPLSNLDAALRVEMRIELAKIKSELNTTVIYVTHDQIEAMTLADKIVVLREGHVEQAGRPMDLYKKPANLFVAGFIGSPKMNFLSASTGHHQNDELTLILADNKMVRVKMPPPTKVSTGTALTIGIRPEHLIICAPGSGDVDGTVMVAERLGGETYFHVQVQDKSVVVKVNGDASVHVGERIGLSIDASQIHLFDNSGQRLG
jgi:ABC-type sugar transport system ATPase subunit